MVEPGRSEDEVNHKAEEGYDVEDHRHRRIEEVESQMGRRGTRGYLFWVILWAVILVGVALLYVWAGRSI